MKQHEIDRHRSMSNQLGMPRGTAANRLRKLVLFDVLKRHGENVCYRCEKIIDFADELSIEHKKHWENVDVVLFWDLNNIAFSHLKCNIRGKRHRGGAPRRKVGPLGTAWCSTCKKFLTTDNFNKNASHWNGVTFECRDCIKTYKDLIRKTATN